MTADDFSMMSTVWVWGIAGYPLSTYQLISDDGNQVIVFNGEVYNFHQIQKELSELGCHFHSSSDTEVVLNASPNCRNCIGWPFPSGLKMKFST